MLILGAAVYPGSMTALALLKRIKALSGAKGIARFKAGFKALLRLY
jgi:hypothetical protein